MRFLEICAIRRGLLDNSNSQHQSTLKLRSVQSVSYEARDGKVQTLAISTSAELPDSDDTPGDNELQNLIPNLLEAILALAWSERMDWFFGVDMGIYHTPGESPLVPDGFLSLGIKRFIGEEGRLSYVYMGRR